MYLEPMVAVDGVDRILIQRLVVSNIQHDRSANDWLVFNLEREHEVAAL